MALQVGVTPEGVEVPKAAHDAAVQAIIRNQPEGHRCEPRDILGRTLRTAGHHLNAAAFLLLRVDRHSCNAGVVPSAELRRSKRVVARTPSGASWRGSGRGRLSRSMRSSTPHLCTQKVCCDDTRSAEGLLGWGMGLPSAGENECHLATERPTFSCLLGMLTQLQQHKRTGAAGACAWSDRTWGVYAAGFEEWESVVQGWGSKMLATVSAVAELAAQGFGLPRTAFSDLMACGPHLLAPTGM
jgi:hypothetical protein